MRYFIESVYGHKSRRKNGKEIIGSGGDFSLASESAANENVIFSSSQSLTLSVTDK